jgi:hypothetical protein
MLRIAPFQSPKLPKQRYHIGEQQPLRRGVVSGQISSINMSNIAKYFSSDSPGRSGGHLATTVQSFSGPTRIATFIHDAF